MNRIEKIWYQGGWQVLPLLPISWLFRLLVAIRYALYRHGRLKASRFLVPVIVVGNITVGGTGKTPFTIWLVNFLRRQGYRPGIVSRGYGGRATAWPQPVTSESDAALVGDEAVLLARRCQCPMVVAPDRTSAVKMLLDSDGCDIVISDDGLQHYAMGRDIEIVIVDGQRRFGNEHLLPAGPLREPLSRLRDVDLVIVNEGEKSSASEYRMTLARYYIYNLMTPEKQKAISAFKDEKVHAVAGIGDPQRFFNLLKKSGVEITQHPFPDHHAYCADDLAFDDDKVVMMTEKDAVKCAAFAKPNHWVMAIEMSPENEVEACLEVLLKEIDVTNK